MELSPNITKFRSRGSLIFRNYYNNNKFTNTYQNIIIYNLQLIKDDLNEKGASIHRLST